ncbi:contractile injection system protein, VgrG/Pvc8 family [Massilia sp. SM-13]|uniref:contractile injection system protein, VgrG/Pvc8 family n=1 Tax=Pseudoduganella rhizocola TaxID=3382643 RepID=UPI0038B525BD
MNAPLQTVAITPELALPQGAPAPYLHVAIFLPPDGQQPQQILGDETFRLVSFEGEENASELFEFQLQLHANTDTSLTPPAYLGTTQGNVQLTIDELVGLPLTVGINCPGPLSTAEMTQAFASAVRGEAQAANVTELGGAEAVLAFFNGIITSISMAEQGVYYITMGPALAQLMHTNAYTIYGNLNIISAIQAVIQTSDGFPTPVRMQSAISTTGNASLATARVQDWLQAGESHYDFIERLVKKAKLFFYFVHTPTSHTVVFADNSNLNYPPVNTSIAAFRYTETDGTEMGMDQEDVIANYRYQRSLSSSSVSSTFARQYANFEEDPPTTPASYQAAGQAVPSQPVLLPLALHKAYDFGALQNEVSVYTNAANAALAAQSVRFSGTATCAQFRAGHTFQLAGIQAQHVAAPPLGNTTLFRPSFAGGSFVLTQVKHQASAEGRYQNDFAATTASGLISEFRPEQAQQETLLAIVVETAPNWQSFTPDYFHPETANFSAPAGPLSYTPTGVHVVFAADPSGTAYFVKLSASMQIVPEAGAIVVVSRAQNESELPEVQNVISSSGSKCATPSGWEASTRVSNNYSTSFGDNQSYSFGKNSSITPGGSAYNTAVGIVSRQYRTGYYGNASYAQGASFNYAIAEGMALSSSASVTALENELDDMATATGGSAAAIALNPAAPTPDATATSPIPPAPTLQVPPLQSLMQSAMGTGNVSTPSVISAPPISSPPLVPSELLLNVSESYGSTYSQSQANVTASIENVGTAYSQATVGLAVNWNTTTVGSSAISNNQGYSYNVSSTTGEVVNINTNLANSTSLNTTMGNSTEVSVTQGTTSSTTIQQGDVTNIIKQNGSVITTTTQTGNGKIENKTTQTGDVINTTTQGGAVTNTTTIGGVLTNTNSYLGAVFDTNTHAGAVTTLNTQLGLVSTVHTYGGLVSEVVAAMTAKQIYQYGAADVYRRAFGGKTQTDSHAASDDTEVVAAKVETRTFGDIELTEIRGTGTVTTTQPGVVETKVSGLVTQTVEMMTIL